MSDEMPEKLQKAPVTTSTSTRPRRARCRPSTRRRSGPGRDDLRRPQRQRLLRHPQGRRRRQLQAAATADHGADRPVRLRQVDVHPLPEPDERPDPVGARGGRDPLPRPGHLRVQHRPGAGAQAHRHGLPEAEPVPEVDLRQHRLRPAAAGREGQHGRDRRAGAAPRRAVGRGQGPPEDERLRHVRRPAAASVHRPRAGHRARRAADGRAVLARSTRSPRAASRT